MTSDEVRNEESRGIEQLRLDENNRNVVGTDWLGMDIYKVC